ncbi:malolactic regulator [Liquorilactobacillus sucicola DSM 21376 = JCM 15457]|uniref:MleR protein n=1 Tax=Liquorilactobacillus sucicola DSM 21376 = JCM 15457 TaxID=1423806 RepID=A0A023CZW8_9LACO|nr:LysR family transcriptional regulator [Liquorilactobacillus sucicola]KRN07218.1 mleR protein [Liquorilactobacillus sucicola DSM 21376 = JCM 15457]GAJ27349.1 malolactic regulator [Liquorilactobacillus sucicola DSM 21376 = JCM 15457]
MKIRDLTYFSKLASLKNFTAVADYFSVRQPTITMAVKRLEREFDTTLVLRDQSHQSILITPSGHQLLKHAHRIIDEVELTNLDMAALNQEQVRFGLPPIIGHYFFPKAASRLAQAGLLSQLAVTETGSGELLTALEDGKLDIALLGSTHSLNNSLLNATLLAKHHFKIIVSPKSHLASQQKIAFQDLHDEKFIMQTEDFVHPTAFGALNKFSFINPNIIYKTGDITLLKNLVHENVGIGFLTETALTPQDELVSLALTDSFQPEFLISLVFRQSQLPSATQKKVIDILIQALRTDSYHQ